MRAWEVHLWSALQRITPGANAVFPFVRDNSDPLQRDMAAVSWPDLVEAVAEAVGAEGNGSGFSPAFIANLDRLARISAAERLRQGDNSSARPVLGVNHVMLDGQSLSDGWDGVPVRTTTAPYASNVMIGTSIRSSGLSGPNFTPYADNTLRPLLAVDNNTRGETVAEQALAFFKAAMSDRAGVREDTARILAATSCGWGGQTIEALSKGAAGNQFNRKPTACTAIKNAATALGLPYSMLAYLWLQGEANYGGSGTTDKNAYKALMRQLVADVRADCQVGIADQARPFGVFTYQTDGQYTIDSTGLSIGMAQLELSEEESNWYLVSPAYPYPEGGGHLTANGYAWLGQQFGKVMARVLLQGERWRPLSPLSVTMKDREILIVFHVPTPPLVFRACYSRRVATMFENKGFVVYDGGGVIPIASVEIVADTVIRIRLGRDTSAGLLPRVRYGGQATYSGHGNVADSDPTVATTTYEYLDGMLAGDNIPELVGKPYPLWNWSVSYDLPVVNAL